MKISKLFSLMALLALTTFSANAETLAEVEEAQNTQEKATIELPAWVKNIKFSGYGMLQYQGQDKEGGKTNTFNLRLARFILDGKIGDFDWRAQIQGTNAKGAGERKLLHYQVGLYNGEGINRSDKNTQKDIIGGLWVMPIKGVRIGAFGWHGSHGGMVTKDGNNENVSLNRYCLSAEYDKDEYTFRAEYLHSQGWGTGVIGSNVINYDLGDKADGWYVFGIVPLIKSKLHAKARYQSYRVSADWASSVNQIECGLNYFFTKNLELHLEYSHVNDRTLADHNYNLVDMELDFRF